jgi:hypothetical protein
MDMQYFESHRTEMNLMWVLMCAMIIVDVAMIIYHSKLHDRIKALEELIKKLS